MYDSVKFHTFEESGYDLTGGVYFIGKLLMSDGYFRFSALFHMVFYRT